MHTYVTEEAMKSRIHLIHKLSLIIESSRHKDHSVSDGDVLLNHQKHSCKFSSCTRLLGYYYYYYCYSLSLIKCNGVNALGIKISNIADAFLLFH